MELLQGLSAACCLLPLQDDQPHAHHAPLPIQHLILQGLFHMQTCLQSTAVKQVGHISCPIPYALGRAIRRRWKAAYQLITHQCNPLVSECWLQNLRTSSNHLSHRCKLKGGLAGHAPTCLNISLKISYVMEQLQLHCNLQHAVTCPIPSTAS